MPERERKQKPAPKEREEVVEDVPASSERGIGVEDPQPARDHETQCDDVDPMGETHDPVVPRHRMRPLGPARNLCDGPWIGRRRTGIDCVA